MGIFMSEQQQLFDFEEEGPISRKDKKRKKFLEPVSPAIILQVWELYCDIFWTGKGRKPRLTEERTKLITVAVNQYGADVVKQAVRGCSLSPWHMGQNPSGTLYTSIELILRGSEQIERFSNMTVAYDSGGGFLDED
jgi:hypothetical protein